ncbi:MAG: hypothetical protein ACLT76_02070 [Clostridium fessum]
MLEGFASLVGVISNVMYSYLLIIMLLAVGLYFTLRSRFVQLRLLPESIRVVGEKTDSNSVSAFQALMVSTASRVGTGEYRRCSQCDRDRRLRRGVLDVADRDCGRRIGFC